jgi:hypothetical protein
MTNNNLKKNSKKKLIEPKIKKLSNKSKNETHNVIQNNNVVLNNNIVLNNKQYLLLTKIQKYYDSNNKINQILPILNGSSEISLRIIDWFVTNYSKKNNISYNVNNTTFTVYLNYKAQLKAFSKKQFDPFCRRERINFTHKDIQINTTVGQLNFFKWALENNIINYIKQNIKDIEIDMYVSCKRNKTESTNSNGNRKKRQELSISATKTVNKRNVKILVKFD